MTPGSGHRGPGLDGGSLVAVAYVLPECGQTNVTDVLMRLATVS